MKLIRRGLAALLAAAVLTSSAFAAPVCSSWFIAELSALSEAGMLPAAFNDADLTQPITRQEVCQMAMAFWGSQYEIPAAEAVFYDTDDPDVSACAALGLVSGYGDGNFGPADPLSRQQLFCIAAQLLQLLGVEWAGDPALLDAFYDRYELAGWATDAAALLLSLDVIEGSNGLLSPLETLTREQTLAGALARSGSRPHRNRSGLDFSIRLSNRNRRSRNPRRRSTPGTSPAMRATRTSTSASSALPTPPSTRPRRRPPRTWSPSPSRSGTSTTSTSRCRPPGRWWSTRPLPTSSWPSSRRFTTALSAFPSTRWAATPGAATAGASTTGALPSTSTRMRIIMSTTVCLPSAPTGCRAKILLHPGGRRRGPRLRQIRLRLGRKRLAEQPGLHALLLFRRVIRANRYQKALRAIGRLHAAPFDTHTNPQNAFSSWSCSV